MEISKQLIDLRTKRGNTQEELAKHSNVSIQAVGKWELGESTPKLPLLSGIAEYYHTTVDELLGGGEVRKNDKIEHFCANAKKHYDGGHIEKAVEIWREACYEYPRDMFFVSQLMYALHDLNTSAENSGVDVNEIIDLGKTILSESSNDSIREKTITVLCINFCKCGRYDEAKEYAHLAPGMANSYERIMANILLAEGNQIEGEELHKRIKNNYIDLIISEANDLCIICGQSSERKDKVIELFRSFLKLLFPNDNLHQIEEGSSFSQSVMKKIKAIKGQLDNNRPDIVEKYYQEHGTYKGIEDWLDSHEKTSDN